MTSRKEYFKNYYQEHKQKILEQVKKDYKIDKIKHLTYQQNYYIENKDMILLKAKLKKTEKSGHAYDIWAAVTKYAKKWNIPFVSWKEFREWAMTDPGYESVYQQWKSEDFSKVFSPVAMRGVKKNGFVPDNLKWGYKEQYSWWSQELQGVRRNEEKQEELRSSRNARTKEWQKQKRAELKAKLKGKQQ